MYSDFKKHVASINIAGKTGSYYIVMIGMQNISNLLS